MSRIVITGLGACSCVGDNAQDCFDAFLAGRQGNRTLHHLNPSQYNSKIAYERDETGPLDGKFRSSGFLTRALSEAVAMAGFDPANLSCPVYVGTGLRELRSVELTAIEGGSMSVSDLDFTRTVNNVLPQAGPVMTLSNACAASNYALALAMDAIQLGAPYAIAAGCDTLTSSMFGLLDRVNPETVEAVQVFDQMRKGVLMGDGGVALIIEREDTALAAGRTPLAHLLAVGLSTDAVHETAPDEAGIMRALADGYERAGIGPQDVDLIYVHGTGTGLNDATESAVLARSFEGIADKPALSGIKAMTGHTSGASGAIGVVSAVKSLQTNRVPPTPGVTRPLPEIEGFGFSTSVQDAEINVVQVNAFGFGGVNSMVLLQRYEEQANAL